MNKLDQAKIHLYLNQMDYSKLEKVISKSEKNEKYMFEYIIDKFLRKYNAIPIIDLTKILCCMNDKYVLRTLCYLLDEPNFPNAAMEMILKNKKFNEVISGKRNAFISHYVDGLNFPGIISLYNAENTTDKDREFIKKYLHEKICAPANAYNLALAQKVIGTTIIHSHFIENSIMDSGVVNYIYALMKLGIYNNKKLINRLASLKNVNGYNKKVFIRAMTEFYPEDLAKVPFGVVVDDIISSIDNADTCTELIVNASNRIAKKIEEGVICYSDKDTKVEPVKKINNLN